MAAETVGTFKIFVGNIPDGATSDEIRQIFEEFGTVVECDCLGNKGFVHMEDDIEGKHAIGQLQGRELKGHPLKIEESRKPGFARIPAVKLFVKNVSSTVDARGLRNMFKRFGYVLEVHLLNGEGHVSIEATGDIKCALKEMNGHVIDEMAMTVEPGPVVQPPDYPTSPKKMKPSNWGKPSGGKDWNDWSSPGPSSYHQPDEPEPEPYEYEDDYYGYGNDNDYADYPHGPNPFEEPNPFEFPFQRPDPFYHEQPFVDPAPERILRDPYSQLIGNGRSRGGRGPRFRGRGRGLPPAPFMNSREPPPGRLMMPPGPPRGMRSGPPRGRGGFPHQMFNHPPDERIPRDRFSAHIQHNEYEEEQVFYEDEPIHTPAAPLRVSLSGANMMPIGGGGEELVSRTPGPPRGGFAGRRGAGRGRGRGRFTAVTEDVAPGQKYPVPPMHNPSFRAPMKWPKEEVKRKVKRKKQPLVPAELPDYTLPVPDLPRPSVPRGAVLKPFPPPSHHNSSGISQMEFSDSNGAGPSRTNSQIDFTSDE